MKRTTDDAEASREFAETRTGRVSEWVLLAATVDRLSFVLYSTITFILLACFC